MTGDVITGQGDHLDPPLLELGLQLHAFPQLGRAYWGVIRGMGKQDAPTLPNEVMEFDLSNCCVSLKVWESHRDDL